MGEKQLYDKSRKLGNLILSRKKTCSTKKSCKTYERQEIVLKENPEHSELSSEIQVLF